MIYKFQSLVLPRSSACYNIQDACKWEIRLSTLYVETRPFGLTLTQRANKGLNSINQSHGLIFNLKINKLIFPIGFRQIITTYMGAFVMA